MALEGMKDYVRKRSDLLTICLAVALVVFALYMVTSLIIWNQANLSYGITFAAVAAILYLIARRLLGYLVTRKEGVIEGPKRL